MEKIIDITFDNVNGNVVFQLFPKTFYDNRGWFAEVLKEQDKYIDIKQINRSCSKPGVIRGMHAQKGKFCQAKLVEALNTIIIDVILDARPESKTFGKTNMYVLSPKTGNKLFVPKGFLHGFIVPISTPIDALFNYYCDNVYDKDSEICINPKNVIQPLLEELMRSFSQAPKDLDIYGFNSYIVSDKDLAGRNLNEFLAEVKKTFDETGKTWYE